MSELSSERVSTAPGNRLVASARSLITSYIEYGTTGYPETVARKLRILNGLSATASFLGIAFALRYAIADLRTLYPLYLWCIFGAITWIVTPVFHRFGEAAGICYYFLAITVTFVIFCYLSGSSSGVHNFLLAAPAVILVFGAKRIAVALALMAFMMSGFFLVQYGFPLYSAIAPLAPDVAATNTVLCIISAGLMLFWTIYYSVTIAERAEAALEREYARSETLLQNMMPASIAARLKDKPEDIIADQFNAVTILFADIVNFTPRAGRLAPHELVRFLNRVFSEFDRLAEKHGLEKIKTIGDAYMVAGGMPEQRDGHAAAVADMALDMIDVTERLSIEFKEDLAVRVGVHTGPAVAGVIGTRKLFYDVWGDTVNTAARMESQGNAGRIQVTEDAKEALGAGYTFERRGPVDVKGKGEMELYYLTGRAAA